jgi:hypothetical protein
MAPPKLFQLSFTSDRAPARKARPAIQTISRAVANMPAMVPAISIGGGSLGARAGIRKGVKKGIQDMIFTTGASGVRRASWTTMMGMTRTIMMGPIRVWASRGVSQKAPMAANSTAYIR